MASSFEQLATFHAVEKRLRSHFSVFLIIPIFVMNPKIKNSSNKTCNAQEVHPDKWEVKQRIHRGNRKIDRTKQSMLILFAIAFGVISSIIRIFFFVWFVSRIFRGFRRRIFGYSFFSCAVHIRNCFYFRLLIII
jgi:hypothetical protein